VNAKDKVKLDEKQQALDAIEAQVSELEANNASFHEYTELLSQQGALACPPDRIKQMVEDMKEHIQEARGSEFQRHCPTVSELDAQTSAHQQAIVELEDKKGIVVDLTNDTEKELAELKKAVEKAWAAAPKHLAEIPVDDMIGMINTVTAELKAASAEKARLERHLNVELPKRIKEAEACQMRSKDMTSYALQKLKGERTLAEEGVTSLGKALPSEWHDRLQELLPIVSSAQSLEQYTHFLYDHEIPLDSRASSKTPPRSNDEDFEARNQRLWLMLQEVELGLREAPAEDVVGEELPSEAPEDSISFGQEEQMFGLPAEDPQDVSQGASRLSSKVLSASGAKRLSPQQGDLTARRRSQVQKVPVSGQRSPSKGDFAGRRPSTVQGSDVQQLSTKGEGRAESKNSSVVGTDARRMSIVETSGDISRRTSLSSGGARDGRRSGIVHVSNSEPRRTSLGETDTVAEEDDMSVLERPFDGLGDANAEEANLISTAESLAAKLRRICDAKRAGSKD